MSKSQRERVVVALGGNAITHPDEDGSVAADYANLERSLDSLVPLVARGAGVLLSHGNGPQVGHQLIRVEAARGQAPHLPLDLVVADLQGGLGYMIERVLRDKLAAAAIERPVVTLLTLVEVDADDPALGRPAKFVGPLFRPDQVAELERERGWTLAEDRGRGWRRVVPSPEPIAVLEQPQIAALLASGAVVIAAGGGGVPVARLASGRLEGVEAVIDKDLASALLGNALGAVELYLLTAVERVCLAYGTPEEEPLDTLRLAAARAYLAAGHFPAGSMGPKVEAACRFVEAGGRRALITDIFTLEQALAGRTGTWITP